MSAAHRELDGLSLLTSIESIDIFELAGLGFEVDRILKEIAGVVQSMINTISLPEAK